MSNQWIKNTGTQPVGDDVEVEAKRRDGITLTRKASNISWRHGIECSITEYRLIEPKQEWVDEAGAVTKEQWDKLRSKKEWNGEGLPPVGCECEFRPTEHALWCRVEVLAIAGDYFWLGYPDDQLNGEPDTHEKTGQFRPLQTKEDTEREEVIKSLTSDISCMDTPEMIAKGLIKLGYHNGPKVNPLSDEEINRTQNIKHGLSDNTEFTWGAKWARDYILGKNNG